MKSTARGLLEFAFISVLSLVILLSIINASSSSYPLLPLNKNAVHIYDPSNNSDKKFIATNYVSEVTEYISNGSNLIKYIYRKNNLTLSYDFHKDPPEKRCISNESKKVITWDYAYQCTEHGFNGTLYLTKKYGKYNLTPSYDINNGPTDDLYPSLLPAALSIYKITHDQKYLKYARSAADSINVHMLNDKNIIRTFSCKNGPSDIEPTDLNNYLLTSIAELAIYDPDYKDLARKVADGIVSHGLSKNNIPYGSIYPNGTAAETENGLSSNGGNEGTLSITIVGLLRTYEATGNKTYLNKSRDILLSIWRNEKTKCNLIPRIFDSKTLVVKENDPQLYATGEFLRAYIYYYYLTHDQTIKNIISAYSAAAYNAYWSKTNYGQGYFVYRVNAQNGGQSSRILETNWHKLDISLIYAGEISGNNYTERAYQDMKTFWLGAGLSYKNYLFRHGTNPDGSPAHNRQSLIYASMRTANYMMLRMLNTGDFNPSNCTWNDKIWNHINSTQFYHYHEYGYHGDVSVETLKPDPKYYGLSIIPACGEFASLITLMFSTTSNVKMVWESFPDGDYVLEPFPEAYSSDDIGFMRGVFMDYSNKEIAFKNIRSNGKGKVNCSQHIAEVREDGRIYTEWHDTSLNISSGCHEYVIIFKGGNFSQPIYQ